MSISVSYNKYRIGYNDGEYEVITEELTAFDDDYIIKRAKKLEAEGATNVKVIKYSEEEIYSSKKSDSSEVHTYSVGSPWYSMVDNDYHLSLIWTKLTLDNAYKLATEAKRENPGNQYVIIDEVTNKEIKTL